MITILTCLANIKKKKKKTAIKHFNFGHKKKEKGSAKSDVPS